MDSVQWAQCVRGYVHIVMRPHHQTVVTIVVLKLKRFVTEVWLKCIEITTTKKAISFHGKKLWMPHRNSAHSAEIG